MHVKTKNHHFYIITKTMTSWFFKHLLGLLEEGNVLDKGFIPSTSQMTAFIFDFPSKNEDSKVGFHSTWIKFRKTTIHHIYCDFSSMTGVLDTRLHFIFLCRVEFWVSETSIRIRRAMEWKFFIKRANSSVCPVNTAKNELCIFHLQA